MLLPVGYYFEKTGRVLYYCRRFEIVLLVADGLCATGGNVMGHASTCRILLTKAAKKCIAIMIDSLYHDSRRRDAEEYSKRPEWRGMIIASSKLCMWLCMYLFGSRRFCYKMRHYWLRTVFE